jgi:drug/metabolite transporter (DMT)-like permease
MLPPLTRKHYASYGLICLIWGSTWGAIRLLVRDVPPLRAAAVRFFLAAVLLVLIAAIRTGRPSLSSRQWFSLAVLGITMMALPYGLLFWAEYRITSSLTAILFSSCPLFVALFTPLLSKTRVPRRAVFAMLIALGGISALFYTELYASTDLLLGGSAVVLAVIVSAWSSVFAKRELAEVNPLWGTAVQFCVSAVALSIASVIFERDRPSDWNPTSILALAFLTVFGSVIAFSIYYWLLRSVHAYQLSTTNLVVPVVAMAEGALLLQEKVPLAMAGAAVVVLVSVAIVLRAEDDEVPSMQLNSSSMRIEDE